MKGCSDLTLSIGLAASTDYTLRFKDRHDRFYSKAITTDGDGKALIDWDAAEFPAGLFNASSSPLSLEVLDGDSERVLFTAGGKEYACLALIFAAGDAPVVLPDPALEAALVA